MIELSNFDSKVITFATHIANAYKNEEEWESITKLELKEEELTEDFTAMIKAVFYLYQKITGDTDVDFLGFTHIVNRLVVQYIVEEKKN